MKFGVFAQGDVFLGAAGELAQTLKADGEVPVFVDGSSKELHWKQLAKDFSGKADELKFILLVGSKGLELLSLSQNPAMAPVHVDFSSPQWQRRLQNISAKKELAARALGIGLNKSRKVLDTCAGLGQDLFVFSALGAEVLAYERSIFVYSLLRDALERASHDHKLKDFVGRIKLVKADARSAIENDVLEGVEGIYLDPMFPEKRHKSQAKKEMNIFQSLIGDDQDSGELFAHALAFLDKNKVCSRVVVKRPKHASVLSPEKLGRQEKGNSTRFDIYF